ncbi:MULTISPECIES: cytochrome P450 [Pseudonocardia]|uniref:Steroid C26-monooxygenase n=2 Tax=Pseudonocardia TaxID=1847 RepID=A0A1Y2N046_PSEAH|nr:MULTISPECIES: cytochrome P450 [Pseudonocardia]OSY40792.1 Steroid C26-monooxygenase [Pseudonocardia autotrophica]TDN71901.1 cytochrome P450 [Pseudonocardia autotrophica]BBG02589.1 cytochrome P450 [Pseudonocardia autotrophica]GEC24648.1 cytochrome P450 [Pseudonocardia saturnea]
MASVAAPHVPIEDPQFYLDDPWPTFAWMRENAPFHYYPPLDACVLTRHVDVKEVASRATEFVSSRGIFLNDWKYADHGGGDQDETLTDSFFPRGGEQVGTTDPPRHTELRRVIAPAFAPRALRRMQERLTVEIETILSGIVPGAVTDWMPYAGLVPIKAATTLLGLPDADVGRVQFWSDELEKLGGDLTLDELRAAAAEFHSLQQFILDNAEAKRRDPGGEDLLSVLLEAELDDDKLSEANVIMFAMTVLAAGSDTTRALLAGLVHHLARHPEQWEMLRADRSLVPRAIEETLRYVTPARAFGRTAVADTTVNGREVAAGQRLYLMYMAANRDETVFPDPGRFDITRQESTQHLALSTGAHVCAGAALVRLQAPLLVEALLDRFAGIEAAGEAVPVRHVIRNSWTRMPMRFRT